MKKQFWASNQTLKRSVNFLEWFRDITIRGQTETKTISELNKLIERENNPVRNLVYWRIAEGWKTGTFFDAIDAAIIDIKAKIQ